MTSDLEVRGFTCILQVGKDKWYRGYIFDEETGLYYLQSRYYDSGINRWISADDIECLGAEGDLLSYNLFAYCLNNPVNRTDANGNWS